MDPTWDYTGYVYLLGHTEDGYGIWHRDDLSAPAEIFPRTDDGWREAWGRYVSLEPGGTPVDPSVRTTAPPSLTVEGEFKKLRIAPLRRYGQWRGNGRVTASPDGLVISGKHVLSLGVRWLILVGVILALIAIGSVLFALAFFTAIFGLIALYALVEYVILQSDEIEVPWASVKACFLDGPNYSIVFELDGQPRHKNPAVLTGVYAANLFSVVQIYLPTRSGPIGHRAGF